MQDPWEMSTCAWACIQHDLSEPAPAPPTPSKPETPKTFLYQHPRTLSTPQPEKCLGPSSSPSPIAQHLLEQQIVCVFHAQEPFPPRNTKAPAGSIFSSGPRQPHPAKQLSKKAPQIPSTPPREMS